MSNNYAVYAVMHPYVALPEACCKGEPISSTTTCTNTTSGTDASWALGGGVRLGGQQQIPDYFPGFQNPDKCSLLMYDSCLKIQFSNNINSLRSWPLGNNKHQLMTVARLGQEGWKWIYG